MVSQAPETPKPDFSMVFRLISHRCQRQGWFSYRCQMLCQGWGCDSRFFSLTTGRAGSPPASSDLSGGARTFPPDFILVSGLVMIVLIGCWGCSIGKSFPFVRAYVRAVWLLSGIGSQKRLPVFFLALLVPLSFPFSLFGTASFPFSLPPPPHLLSNFSWANRYYFILLYYNIIIFFLIIILIFF